jgi:hypothetical protein
MIEKQKQQAETVTNSVLDWSIGPVLQAQTDILSGAEATFGDWLRRRHEAVADTRQLIANMHVGTDPREAFKAQREWMSRSLRRLAADADAYHSTAQTLLERAKAWFPENGVAGFPREATGADATASQAAAARAAGKPLRMANRSD